MMPNWDEVKQGMQCLVGGELGFSFPAVREQAADFSACEPAGQSGLFTGVKHPVGTAQWQYWHCLELALNVQCLVLLVKLSLM